MSVFLDRWAASATTTAGLFWMAFWAFGLGYLISGMVQVFVTRERMQRSMGQAGAKSVGLATVFGFISSSCSFAALSTTRALFAKGAGLVPALAFLLASTNLVIELGVVISVFLGWQFVVGEYVGGLLLILFTWVAVKLTLPRKLEQEARDRARAAGDGHHHGDGEDEAPSGWRERIASVAGWRRVAEAYVMEWGMVWKDVSIGFTVAGAIAAFVPAEFFHALFPGAGTADPSAVEVALQTLVGPLAAFFTFIGSMGNIPLAAVLFGNGVSFAGVMAFIFSDLVVLPVLRIQARYYGWKTALYVLGVFLVVLVAASLVLHGAFAALDWLPDPTRAQTVSERTIFAVDITLVLNVVFLLASGVFVTWTLRAREGGHDHGQASLGERVLLGVTLLAYVWLAVGGLLAAFR